MCLRVFKIQSLRTGSAEQCVSSKEMQYRGKDVKGPGAGTSSQLPCLEPFLQDPATLIQMSRCFWRSVKY
jgi:hypothetical protein